MAGLALLGGAVPASAQTLTWSVVHSPNRRAGGNILDAVSCVSAKVCMATGDRLNSGGSPVTLAESWDGTRWTLVRSPNRGRGGNQLVAVSCVSANACMAVGFTQGGPGGTLAESWNGTRWSVVPTPSPGSTGSDLSGVSCVAANACTAVGASSSNGNTLSTLIESWDGTRWSVLTTPSPGTSGNFLNGVSCVSPDTCTAAGNSFYSNGPTTSLIESWDGSHWSVAPSPSPGIGQTLVNGVSCAAKNACSVVGSYNTRVGTKILVESWDGSRWSLVPTPNPGTIDHELNGVSCASPDFCMAAGFFFSHHPNYRTLIESGTATG